MIKIIAARAWSFLKSFQLTIVLLALLMCLVLFCTLAQVEMGTQGAVDAYMRSFIVWNQPLLLRLPFPGGALVGLLLTLNLLAKTIDIKLSWQKSGMWLVHAGLVVLFAGEFVAGMMQVDTNLSIEVGQTVNFVQSYKQMELAVIDVTDPTWDEVYSVPDTRLAKGGAVAIPGTPITLNVKKFYANAELSNQGPGAPPSLATAGIGACFAWGTRIWGAPPSPSRTKAAPTRWPCASAASTCPTPSRSSSSGMTCTRARRSRRTSPAWSRW